MRTVPGHLRLTADGVLVLHNADFAVSTTAGSPDPVSYRIAVADFGRPARVYHFGDRTIMVWDINLLADLGASRTQ